MKVCRSPRGTIHIALNTGDHVLLANSDKKPIAFIDWAGTPVRVSREDAHQYEDLTHEWFKKQVSTLKRDEPLQTISSEWANSIFQGM